MCGINGIAGDDPELVAAMNFALRHRGPDHSGVWRDKRATLGQVLLSIRGPVAASVQPVASEETPWVLAFAGQLYNTGDLQRFTNRKTGRAPEDELDTDLLHDLVLTLGWGFVTHVHGMYTIALYNRDEGKIRLYRDPSGQKPLYYYEKDGRFAFSSEIRGLLRAGIDRTVDREAVEVAACMGYIPGRKTLFRHVSKVEPSECVSFDLETRRIRREPFVSDLHGRYAEGGDDMRAPTAISRTVDEHLQGRYRPVLNLSGGMDSSTILHWAHQWRRMRLTTYTTLFEGAEETFNRDAVLARKLAAEYGTEHREIRITKEAVRDSFVKSYRAIEEPDYNNSIPHMFLLARTQGILGDGNRVVLSGDGGDEVFVGYPHHHEIAIDEPESVAVRDRDRHDLRRTADRWILRRRFANVHLLDRRFDVLSYVRDSAERYLHLYRTSDSPVHEAMLCDRALWLPAENFTHVDKLWMGQSVEVRAPYSYMPFRRSIDLLRPEKGASRERPKRFLRDAHRGLLPDYILQRPEKTGWKSPIRNWYDRAFRHMFLEILAGAGKSALVDWEAVRRRVEGSDTWPGKTVHLYLSLAILKMEYGLDF